VEFSNNKDRPYYKDAAPQFRVTNKFFHRGCFPGSNVISSPDALGLLAHICCAGSGDSVARLLSIAKTFCQATSGVLRKDGALRLDGRVPMAGNADGGMEGVGSRPVRAATWIALAGPKSMDCFRRRPFGSEFAPLVKFAKDRRTSGRRAGTSAEGGRAHLAKKRPGVFGLRQPRGYCRDLRGISLPGFRNGRFGAGRARFMGDGYAFVPVFRLGARLSRASGTCEHALGRRGVCFGPDSMP